MLTIVLPAYNETEAIVPLLGRIKAFVDKHATRARVIVVDDGSSDDTDAQARAFRGLAVQVVPHLRNRGLSAAIQTGLTAALAVSEDDDVIVTMDADDTHPPALISRMLRRIDEGYDLVIASRYCPDSRIVGLSRWRRLLSKVASELFRWVFPIAGVRDYTCGYRAYRAGLLRAAFARYGDHFIDQPGFSCMVDILLKLAVLRPIIVEVPFILRYDRKPGTSKMNVRRTTIETLSLMVHRRMGLPMQKAA